MQEVMHMNWLAENNST